MGRLYVFEQHYFREESKCEGDVLLAIQILS